MATITDLNSGDDGATSRGVINTNFDNLNTDKLEAADLPSASDSAEGMVELATDAEALAGSSDSVVLTPGNLGYTGFLTGWIPAGETWTYASATTFTIAGDKTGKYQKGDKIKLTNSSVKYFYIIGVSYSSPNTTITVTGGSDYSLVSGDITNPYYSKQENPQGFPGCFNWTPSFTCSESMTYSSLTISTAKFQLVNNIVTLFLRVSGTIGGTASNEILFTVPIAADISSAADCGGTILCGDNTASPGYWYAKSSTTIAVSKAATADWTLGSNRRITGICQYKI